MRTFIVFWDNGESETIHGPFPDVATTEKWVYDKAREVWDMLFDDKPPVDNREHELRVDLRLRSGNAFRIAVVVPPDEQPDEFDIIL